jgi:hypothetical protein
MNDSAASGGELTRPAKGGIKAVWRIFLLTAQKKNSQNSTTMRFQPIQTSYGVDSWFLKLVL